MTIQELKKSVEDKSVGSSGIIFVSENTFIPKQYIKEISSIYNKDIVYVDSINQVKEARALFSSSKNNHIFVYITDKLEEEVVLKDFCYIICKSYKGKNSVVIPKLETWHLVDYAVTNSSSNIHSKDLENLVNACKNDIFLIDNELSKFNIFEDKNQNSIYQKLFDENQLTRSFDGTIFEFTNALLSKDVQTLVKFYSDLQNYDVEPLGVVTIIYKQLKNIILVGFNKNPTEENTGLSAKQIYAIKKNLNKYSSKYILESFQCIIEAEKLLKEGTLSNNQLLDYVVVNLL